jgi:UDP-MurNAc hydroxylase
MRVTFLGQAGLYIETGHGTILCDPWFNPAFFASWFPFPSNEGVDVEAISHPDYLYVSHLHHDHFDPEFLRDHVDKDAVVLLPDYPINHLERELSELGFHRFVKTRSAEEVVLSSGLRIMIVALVAPTDGPIGDSGLAVDDGATRLFNQNDSRPIDLEPLRRFGHFDAHFLQFSGAIWYPMVYDFPPRMKQTLGRKKRQNEMARAKRYAEEVGASYIFPSAGPPCFLDPELFELNDFDRDPSNTFPDQTVFIEYLQGHGMDSGRLLLPGSVATLEGGGCEVRHPTPDAVERIFSDKRAYLKEYQARRLPEIERRKASWSRGQLDDLVGELKRWWEPLLAQANLTCEGINGRVLLEVADAERCDEQIVIDYLDRRVDAWKGEPYRYRFRIDRALVETCVVQHLEDWVNELFLSCRFETSRDGPYNEYIYNWFKALSPERLQYAEGWYAEQAPVQELIQMDGYLVQRRCPHLKADLAQFGEVEDGVLTCRMHGWQFDLETGRCLTSDDRRLHSVPASSAEGAGQSSRSETGTR